MNKINSEIYHKSPARYELVSGASENAPTCPYGNMLQWVGYDKEEKAYVRFTKSVYKHLLKEKEKTSEI